MVGRTTSCGRIDALKTKCAQVEFIDENIDHAHWIFFGYVVVQTLRQQGDLRPSLTFNKSLHDRPRYDLDDQKIRQLREFSHSLEPEQEPSVFGNAAVPDKSSLDPDQYLEALLKEIRLDFLASMGEAERYKLLLDDMPHLRDKVEGEYL